MAKKVNRRSLIQATSIAAAGVGNLNFFTKNIIEGLFNQAMAQEMGILDKKYLFIQQSGAPPRWFFDAALHPDGDKSKFKAASQVGTRFTGGSRYTNIEYATTKVQGLDMPWVWSFRIPRPGGGTVPMANLAAEGMLSIRGANTNNPAHAAAQGLQSRPLGITSTLNSLTSDVAGLPIGAVNVESSRYQFTSKKGLASARVGGNNLVQSLMTPFRKPALGSFETDSEKVANALKNTRGLLDQMAKQRHPGADIVANSTESAIELISRDFGNLDTVFTALYNKYRDLIQRAIKPGQNLNGITDKAIGATSDRDLTYRYGRDNAVTNTDLRTMITANTNANKMARHFACAEFCLLNNISSSVTINPGGLGSLGTQGGNTGQIFDEHSAGKFASLIVGTHYYLALTSCIYELAQQLKSRSMWQDTVIRLDGEFGRCPRNDGRGSDHSAQGNCISMFSGNIKGLNVIGNITSNGGQSRTGTWGYGASNPGVGGINLGHTASTLAHILGVDSPVTAAESLMKVDGDQLVPRIGTGKII